MRPPLIVGALAILFVAAGPGALRSTASSALQVPLSPSAREADNLAMLLASAVDRGGGSVQAQLGVLDGGPLTMALRRAAHAHRRLSLVLDPYDPSSRAEGLHLEALSPRVHVRWRSGLGAQKRFMDVVGLGAWSWPAQGSPTPLPTNSASERFSSAWRHARRVPPRELLLREQLRALPDPREEDPHYVRRAPGGAP